VSPGSIQPVILDTDVASLSHKRKLTGPLATRLVGRRPLITFVTSGELAKWAEIRNWGNLNRQALADWLSGIPVLPGDEPVAATWGQAVSRRSAARTPPPSQRHVGLRMLPDLRLAARDAQPQGLPGLPGPPRAAHPRLRIAPPPCWKSCSDRFAQQELGGQGELSIVSGLGHAPTYMIDFGRASASVPAWGARVSAAGQMAHDG
jgi:hypothetical protein